MRELSQVMKLTEESQNWCLYLTNNTSLCDIDFPLLPVVKMQDVQCCFRSSFPILVQASQGPAVSRGAGTGGIWCFSSSLCSLCVCGCLCWHLPCDGCRRALSAERDLVWDFAITL